MSYDFVLGHAAKARQIFRTFNHLTMIAAMLEGNALAIHDWDGLPNLLCGLPKPALQVTG